MKRKISKLCLALGITSVAALCSVQSASAAGWVYNKAPGCWVKVVNHTNVSIKPEMFAKDSMNVVIRPGGAYNFHLTGCTLNVHTPNASFITNKNILVTSCYHPKKNAYKVVFTGRLAGSGVSYGECFNFGKAGNRIGTGHSMFSYCLTPRH